MNFLARMLLVNFVRNRLLGRNQPLARRSPYGWGGRAGRRGRYATSFGRARPRTQVRVGGCCLPIPLGVVALSAAGATRKLRSGR